MFDVEFSRLLACRGYRSYKILAKAKSTLSSLVSVILYLVSSNSIVIELATKVSSSYLNLGDWLEEEVAVSFPFGLLLDEYVTFSTWNRLLDIVEEVF